MEILTNIFVLLHFFGFASLFSGLVSQRNIQPKLTNGWILGGAVAQLITGLILTGLAGADINHLKVTLKLGVLLAILFMAFKHRDTVIPQKIYNLLILFTCLNAAIAVLWQ